MPIDAETYAALQQLQRAYADISTRRAWDEVSSVLTDDAHLTFETSTGAVFEVNGARAFTEFAAKMTGFTFFEYIPLSFVVDRSTDGQVVGRAYSLELAENDAGEWSETYGIYEDTYAESDGRWRFSRRKQKTLRHRVTPSSG